MPQMCQTQPLEAAKRLCVEAGGEEMARRLRVATALGARGFDNF